MSATWESNDSVALSLASGNEDPKEDEKEEEEKEV